MNNSEKSAGFWLGMILIAFGLAPMVLVFFRPEGLSVSLLIAQAGASAMVFAGLSFIAQSRGRPGLARAFGMCVVLVLAFVGLRLLPGSG